MTLPARATTCMAAAVWFTVVAVARAGGVLKIDDATVAGEVVAFDGKLVTIETKEEKSATGGATTKAATTQTDTTQPASTQAASTQAATTQIKSTQSIPIEDLLQIRLTGGTPTTAPATQPGGAGATPKPATARQRAAVVQAIRTILGRPNTPAAPEAAQPKPARPATQPVVLSETWHVRLTNGDVLTGALRSWADQRVTLHVQSGGGSVALEIPVGHVAELWHTTPEQARRAKRSTTGAGAGAAAEDVAYVLKDGQVVTVAGVALGIEDPDRLAFRHEGADRTINLARLAGVVLVPQRASGKSGPGANPAFHQVFRLSNGHVLSGRWTALRDNTVTLTTPWDQTVTLPRAAVQTIDCRNGRVVYLSDLEPARVEQTPYFDRVMPWRRDAGLGGGKLALEDGQYDRGITMHARCVLEYDLGGRFENFRARFGFEHPAGRSGCAAVRVVGDGKPLFESPEARGDATPADLDLNVTGVQRLMLEVDFGRDQDVGDRVIFANARLLRLDVGRPQP